MAPYQDKLQKMDRQISIIYYDVILIFNSRYKTVETSNFITALSDCKQAIFKLRYTGQNDITDICSYVKGYQNV